MLEDKLQELKCRAGNKEALCRIYQKYKNYLLTVAKGLLGRHAEAEDVVHYVFVTFCTLSRGLSAHRKLEKLFGCLRL